MATRRQFLKGASYGLALVGGQWVVTEAGAASSGIVAPPAAGGHYFTGDGRLPRAGEGHEPGEPSVPPGTPPPPPGTPPPGTPPPGTPPPPPGTPPPPPPPPSGPPPAVTGL